MEDHELPSSTIDGICKEVVRTGHTGGFGFNESSAFQETTVSDKYLRIKFIEHLSDSAIAAFAQSLESFHFQEIMLDVD
jgi:hypothetical protein